MKRLALFLVCLLLLTAGSAFCDERGTLAEAKAMAEAAAEFYKANGLEKSINAFAEPNGKFVKKDLYVYAMDFKGVMLTHPNAKLVGKELLQMKDPDGKLLTLEMIDVAKSKGAGWVDYKWTNPATKQIQDKTAYIIRIGDAFLACGVYK